MIKLSKKHFGLIIGGLFLIGGFINFYAVNMLMNVICNKGSPKFLLGALPTLAMLTIAIEFVVASLFFLRLYLHPTHTHHFLFLYGILMMSFSFVGLVCDILSATVIYGSMTIKAPFAGAHIIFLLWHLGIIALGALMVFYFPKKITDPDIILHRTNTKHIFITIFWSLVLFYGMNRIGAFLWSPTYITWTNLGDTYPFYISLLLLPAILLNILLYVFNVYKKNAVAGVSISTGTVVLSLFFFFQIIMRGMTDQAFVSSISPALPIERLTTIPIDISLQMVSVVALGVFTLTNSIFFKRLKDIESGKRMPKVKKR